MDLGDVVIVDVDQNTVQTPFDDVRALPSNVVCTERYLNDQTAIWS